MGRGHRPESSCFIEWEEKAKGKQTKHAGAAFLFVDRKPSSRQATTLAGAYEEWILPCSSAVIQDMSSCLVSQPNCFLLIMLLAWSNTVLLK